MMDDKDKLLAKPFTTSNEVLKALSAIYIDLFEKQRADDDYINLKIKNDKTFYEFYLRYINIVL